MKTAPLAASEAPAGLIGPNLSWQARLAAWLRRYLPAILVLPSGLVLWELGVRLFNIQGFLLPAPSQIGQTFVENWAGLLDRGWYTFQEAWWGYLIGCGLGILLGLLIARFATISAALMPIAIAVNAVPIIALSPLVRVWFGLGQPSKIVIVAILCLFPCLISTVRGLSVASPAALELMRSYATPELETFVKLRVPSALPFIFNGLKVCTSLSLIGAVVGEFYGGLLNKSLGIYIANEASQVRFRNSWSGIIVACAFGISFYLLVGLCERVLIPWHVSVRSQSN
jgi:NitT/TauT family transport system permease protein